MTCPHRRYHDVSNLFNGHWATARRCDDCGDWVAWGEANDTSWARYEADAAELAIRYTSGEKIRDVVPRLAGFALHEPSDPRELEYSTVVRDLYNCGLLARYIVDNEEE